ncbi:unnamed protein product [Closterium sp. NIES-53]
MRLCVAPSLACPVMHSLRRGSVVRYSSRLLPSSCHSSLPEPPLGRQGPSPSMVHAHASHFLWPYTVRYAIHQLNLWPRVSRPGISSTGLWTGSLSVASGFRVWGCLALVRDTSADKLSARTITCVFLGFPQPSALPRQVTVDSGGVGVGGAATGGAQSGSAHSGGVGAAGAGTGGAGAAGAGTGGAGAGGAGAGGTGAGGSGTGGASSGGAGARVPDLRGCESGGAGSGRACEEQETLAQERQELQQQPQQPPLLQQLFPPVSGLRALGLPSSTLVSSPSPPAFGLTFPPPDVSPTVYSPPQSPSSPVVPHSRVRPVVSSSTPISDYYRAARPVVPRVLASPVTDPCTSPSSVSALTAIVADFAATHRLDFATRVVAAPPARPLFTGVWKAAMDSEMASWRSTSTYVDTVLPPRANLVDGMWFFKVKLPLGSPLLFKHNELHSLDFSLDFLQSHLQKEIWLRHPPGFTGTFSPGTQWSLIRPDYNLRQAPREWHKTLRTTLADHGFFPSSADPSLFVRKGSTPFFVLVYVDDSVFATADRVALVEAKPELQMRHTCTDLGELRRYLGLLTTRDRVARTSTLSQSHIVQQVVQRFELQFSTTQPTPLAVDHRRTGPFPDEPFESSGPYVELVGCLMCMMTCTRLDLGFLLNVLPRFVATGRYYLVHLTVAMRVAKYLSTTSGMWLVLGGTQLVELTGQCQSSYTDDLETQWSTQGYCFCLGTGAVSWRSTRSSSVAQSNVEAEIYAGAMAAQELRWLPFLLTDLGERPRSAPTLTTRP